MVDSVRVVGGRVVEVWRAQTKQQVCYRIHEGEAEARPIYPQEVVEAVVEVGETPAVGVGYIWDGAKFTAPPPPTPPTPPTLDEIYDRAMLNSQVLRAVVIALNKGTLTVGTNKTPLQLKTIIKAEM